MDGQGFDGLPRVQQIAEGQRGQDLLRGILLRLWVDHRGLIAVYL